MFSVEFLEEMKELLIAKRVELLSKSLQQSDIDSEGDEIDAIQAKLIADVNKSLNSRFASQIKQIDNALKKIEDGCYGQCEDCGEKIPDKRLLINPYFLTCVCCAEKREIKQRKRY